MEIQKWKEILSPYELAVEELRIKFNHIIKENRAVGRYSPIEQVFCRVKAVSSIMDKARRKGIELDQIEEELDAIEEYLDGDEDEDDGCCCCDDDEDEDDEDVDFDYDDDVLYEVKCPVCNEIITIDEDTIAQGSVSCPKCNETLEFEVDEEESKDSCC